MKKMKVTDQNVSMKENWQIKKIRKIIKIKYKLKPRNDKIPTSDRKQA